MLVDLTLDMNNKVPVFPGDPEFRLEEISTHKKNYMANSSIYLSTHFSTHIDAPYHFIMDGKKLDEIEVEKFIGNGIVIDMKNGDAQNQIEDVREGDIVLFYTGHNDEIHERSYFDKPPLIKTETAQKLIDKGVKMVGIDSFTVDLEPYQVHKILLRNNILIIENLTNLKMILHKRFQIIALPLKIHADGSPCRVIAITEE